MRRFFVCVLVSFPPSTATAQPTTLHNGDVNCNNVVDMLDAIYMLNWLFLGTNDGPCPLADPPELLEQIAHLEAELFTERVSCKKVRARENAGGRCLWERFLTKRDA